MAARHYPPFEERLWSKVVSNRDDGCWTWTGNRNQSGYGQLHRSSFDGGHSVLAHRATYESCRGPIPAGMMVCHHCDHPWCVNPSHLFLGTAKDNMADMKAKDRRGKSPRTNGDGHHLAKLTQDKALEIRYLYWNEGWPAHALAPVYGVSNTAIVQVIRRISWNGDLQPGQTLARDGQSLTPWFVIVQKPIT